MFTVRLGLKWLYRDIESKTSTVGLFVDIPRDVSRISSALGDELFEFDLSITIQLFVFKVASVIAVTISCPRETWRY